MVFTNPGIGARAIVDTLNPEQRESADQHDAGVARAELDQAELRSVERTEYYGGGESSRLIIPDTVTIWPDRPIGFPNGRLLSDPVVDITLGVVLLDINRAGQNAASFAALPLNPTSATKPPLPDFPFANTPNDNPVLDPGTGTGFVFDAAPMSSYVQVDRMGMPAVATALILSPRKDAYSDGNVQLDTANTYAFDLIEGLRRFTEPLQDDIAARGLTGCAVRRT